MSFARVRIDLDALASNYRMFCSRTTGEVGAVVKANGYGLGSVPIARRLGSEGCRSFFVATLDEALALQPYIDGDVYVFEPPLGKAGIRETVSAGCIPVINLEEQLAYVIEEPNIKKIVVHIDTGMERTGISYKSVDVDRLKTVSLHLLMTHLACADNPDHPFNLEQIKRFEAIAAWMPSVRTSIGNSAGTLNGPPFQGDLARPGIGLYGANPFVNLKNPTSIVATCEAQVLAIRDIRTGTGIGYGLTHTAEQPTRLAVIGMGYADGVPRVLSNIGNFAWGERLLPIRGRVSMDVTQVDATACPDLAIGDWVEFYGKTIDCDEVAATANSLGYEFLTGLGERVKRLYV